MNFLLIGKPNVGKSSLYNILSSGKKNIIHQEEGTTRDWHKSLVSGYKNIFIYDTPGILIESNKENEFFFFNLLDKIDKFIYVIDYKELNFENEIQSINELRKFNKEIILVINKDDNNEKNYNLSKLGIKTFFFTSCSHKIGIDQIYEYFDKYDQKTKKNEKSFFSVAIFGKPNAGKSTLANSLIGYDRVTTSPIAGTTSDFVEDIFFYKKETFKILDTAGILKKNKIKNNSIDFKAVRNSLDIINKIDLSILLIDSQTGFDSQIKKILNMLLNKSRAVIIVLNKIDTINNKKNFIEKTKLLIKKTYSNSQNLSIIFISAINKVSVNKLKSTLCIKSRTISKKIPTSKLNDFLKKISNEKPHPLIKGKSVKFKYAVQISTHPLIIKVFSNYSKEIKKNYRTFLINKFISTFKILDTKVNLIFTTSKNPFN